jgi:SNF2 family DNA or RNA helicase
MKPLTQPLRVSKKNKVLVVPRDGQTENLFPGAPPLDENSLIVPHGLRETLMLRHLGWPVPSPMLLYFDWCNGKPFAVQRATCDLMTSNERCYVLNSMGTGKTKAALWSFEYLKQQGFANKMLVVATLSTLNFVWAREAFATLPHRKVQVLHGTKRQRLERLDQDADIYIINHDGLKTIQSELAGRRDIDVLCLDELAVYRNNSDRSKHMRKFSERFKVVWGLTGRPMPNAPTDVWSQAKIVTPHTVPKFFNQAQSMLMNKIDLYRFVPKPDAVETAFRMLQPSVRFSLDAVVELPETVYRTVDVPLTPQQTKVYTKLKTEFQTQVEDKTITAVNAAVAMGKLLQVSGGWVYTGETSVALDAKPRHEALVDLIEEAEHKVLVFVPYRHAIAGLSTVLTNSLIEHAIVHGQISGRDEIFNLFQNTTKFKVLLAHPQCLAHGLTLTAADTVIWYMPIPSLDIYEQANARITRVGQKHRQQIFHLQSTPVEKKIYGLLRNKQKIQDALLDLLGEATEAMTTT